MHRTISVSFPLRLNQPTSRFLKSFQWGNTVILSNLFRFLRQWRAYDASLRELSRLGERELADIGVNRSDIARVAWENAERTA